LEELWKPIGALNKITNELLKLADSAFGLIASTVASCLGVNLFASDQYLAIIIPGKMFKNAYKENDLAPENFEQNIRRLWNCNFCFNTMEYLRSISLWCTWC
jgi:Na+/H+ antiporter NhaC